VSSQSILITGVNGLVGSLAYQQLISQKDKFDVFGLDRSVVLSDRLSEDSEHALSGDRLIVCDLSDSEGLKAACEGIDCVVHLAADPDAHADWDSVLINNISGTYNVLEACRLAGVRRVILASSIHTANGHRADEPYRSIVAGTFDGNPTDIPKIRADQPPRPRSLYGASKVAVAALGRTYSEAHGLSCICLRLGWVLAEDRPPTLGDASIFLSQRDASQLIEKSILAPDDLRFDVFYGMSANEQLWVDVGHARDVIGYAPQDGFGRNSTFRGCRCG